MLQAHDLRRHFAAAFRPFDVDQRSGLSFPLNALVPLAPTWETCPGSPSDGGSLAESVRSAFQELRRHGVNALLEAWRERVSYRSDLLRLLVTAPHMIDDIGLSLEQAIAESGRPFWRC